MGNWRLRAESEVKLDVWVNALQVAAAAPPILLSENKDLIENPHSLIENQPSSSFSSRKDVSSFSASPNSKINQVEHGFEDDHSGLLELNASQIARYRFYNSERDFVRCLTDICEELRFIVNVADRGPLLEKRLQEVSIPPVAYLPLVQSTDLFRRILKITPNESRPFSTKARCPALITFETVTQCMENSDTPLDVANFLHWNYIFPGHREKHIMNNTTAALYGSRVVDPEDLTLHNEFGDNINIEDNATKFSDIFGSPQSRDIWRNEKATIFKHPIGLFSPFGVRNFRPPSFNLSGLQMTRRLTKRWGSKDVRSNAMNGGPVSGELASPSNNDATNTWPDIEHTEQDHDQDDQHTDAYRPSSRPSQRIDQRNENSSTENGASGNQSCTGHYGSVGNNSLTGTNTPARDSFDNTNDLQSQELEDISCRAAKLICQGESLQGKIDKLKETSSFSSLNGWNIERVISKSNDDLRQEVFIMQLIYFYLEVFQKENLDLWLQPYRILSTGKSTGLIQVLDNSTSLHGLKKGSSYPGSLKDTFQVIFGLPGSENFKQAQRRFAQSLAGYSVISHLLAFKDRHNGNIMITTEGRLIHIDFGFVFGQAPGGKFSMERAPFKLTQEYADVLGGPDSEMFKYYIDMVGKGLIAAKKYSTVAVTLLEIMMFRSEFPCFAHNDGRKALHGFRKRLFLKLSDSEIQQKAEKMVRRSLNHIGTVLYDKFQLYSNGIRP
jgi:phosphatidylinositol 4-kinase